MSESANWSKVGANIMTPERLEVVRKHLDSAGHIAVLHWHYCGARAPTPLGFGDFDVFLEFLKFGTEAGDAMDVWPFPTDQKSLLVEGKCQMNVVKCPKEARTNAI